MQTQKLKNRLNIQHKWPKNLSSMKTCRKCVLCGWSIWDDGPVCVMLAYAIGSWLKNEKMAVHRNLHFAWCEVQQLWAWRAGSRVKSNGCSCRAGSIPSTHIVPHRSSSTSVPEDLMSLSGTRHTMQCSYTFLKKIRKYSNLKKTSKFSILLFSFCLLCNTGCPWNHSNPPASVSHAGNTEMYHHAQLAGFNFVYSISAHRQWFKMV